MDGKREEKEPGLQRAGVGWADVLGGGRVLGNTLGKPGRGSSLLRSPLPGVAETALRWLSLAWVARGVGLGAPSTPPPQAAGSGSRPPPPAYSGASHGDQSERGCLGGKPREAFIAARVVARSYQDSPPVFQLNGLAHLPLEEPLPAASPPPTSQFPRK